MSNWTRQIRVTSEGDVTRAIVETSETARSLGFDTTSVNKISTATSELARNVIKYADSGEVHIREVSDGQNAGIEIVVRDRGPGIADVEVAMQDHFSSGGTLGLGLPGVRRIMDDFEIDTGVGRGTTVTIRAWLAKPENTFRKSLAVAAVQTEAERRFVQRQSYHGRNVDVGPEIDCAKVIRPCRGELVSGDEVYIERRGDHLILALIDALGHGHEANRAARQAKAVLHETRKASAMALIEALHEGLAQTVGAAASVCDLDLTTYTGHHSAVGNTVGRILGNRDVRLHTVAGVLGSNFRRAAHDRFHLDPGDVLVLYSDGISDRFGMKDYPQISYQSSGTIVTSILERFGKQHDDASCVAVRRSS